MELNTHLEIDQTLNGKVIELKDNYAKIELQTTENMKADKKGLVHGGFIFGAADFAAMVAVNDPYVVLAKSEVKFLAPVKVGDIVDFEAEIIEGEGRKNIVEVNGRIKDKIVFLGIFSTVILTKHVLD